VALHSLHDKVVVVTGAAGGIGGASARRLAQEGARVVVVDLDGDAADKVAAELPTEAIGVAADVSREEDVDRYLAAAVQRFGRIDLHHLNAGITGSVVPITDVTVEEFDRVMAVNLRGVFLGLRGAFRQYSAQGGGGAIVVTASIASLRGSSDLFPYHASKHGVIGLVRNSAVYGGPLGVRVNAIAPGIVPTDLFANDPGAPGGGNDMAQRAMTTPLRRPGRPEEMGSVVAFLLSDDAAYMTGEVVSVDGGATAVNTVRPSGGAGAWDTAELDARTARRP
jgi:NAD(P)-dependent dehydrogenase (short-subunit alcohol dehydrogenase family)